MRVNFVAVSLGHGVMVLQLSWYVVLAFSREFYKRNGMNF